MQPFTREAIEKLFERFDRMRVLIIGDVMIDSYLWGSVDRISPEAPVPVVAVNKRSSRLGGAANVALNIKAMGAEAVLCSVTGKDLRGDELLQLMEDDHLQTEGIMQLPSRITTTKFRIFGNHTQMLRVDEETTHPLSAGETNTFAGTIVKKIMAEKWDVIIFQDYDKGLITPSLIQNVCEAARERGIPVAVDPKKRNFKAYRDVTLFKPNLKEFKEGLKIDVDHRNSEDFQEAILLLHRSQNIEQILITLSGEGVFISHLGKGTHIPAHLRNISDVSGAGDTVISIAALGLASGISPGQTAALGNLAGGLVCEEVGVVPVDREKLFREALRNLCEE